MCFEACDSCGEGMVNISKRYTDATQVWFCDNCGRINVINSRKYMCTFISKKRIGEYLLKKVK